MCTLRSLGERNDFMTFSYTGCISFLHRKQLFAMYIIAILIKIADNLILG